MIDPDPLTIEGLLAVVGRRPFASTWQSDDTDDADAEGVLWGGNLAMIASLAGTPWMPQVENGILFIEDVAEPAYRIERMLLTLDMAGILRRQQAVVVCDLQGADQARRLGRRLQALACVRLHAGSHGASLRDGLSLRAPSQEALASRRDAGEAFVA